jgi:RNA polymerase sigma-70 factor, ECF subfamily
MFADAMSAGDVPEITAGDGRLLAWFGEHEGTPMSETYRLTQAIAHGDEAAFEEFHEQHALRIYRQLLGLTHGDEREAQEICHQVMMKLAGRCAVFDHEDDLRAWLWRVARNTFLDNCRKRQRDRKLIELAGERTTVDPAPAADPLGSAMSTALRGLPDADAELLNAVYVDGRAIAELAVEQGQTYKAMESRLTRLRRRLKEAMLKLMRDEERT